MGQDLKNQTIDLHQILKNYKEHILWFVVSLVFFLAAGGFYLYIKRPVYAVVTKVLITDEKGGGLGGSLMKSLSFLGEGSAETDDEVEIISSHTILSKAITELELNKVFKHKTGFLKSERYYKTSPVNITSTPGVLDTLSVSLKLKIEIDKEGKVDVKVKKGMFKTLADIENATLPVTIPTIYGDLTLSATDKYIAGENYKIKGNIYPISELAEDYWEDIEFYATSKKANTIIVSTESADTKLTKDLLNKIVELYNIRGVDVKNEIAQKTKEFIDERLEIVYADLSKTESSIEKYKQRNDFVDIEAEVKYQLKKKGELESEILAAQSKGAVLKMIKDFLAKPENRYALIPFTGDSESSISEGVAEYNTIILEYLKLKNNSKADNALLVALQKQIEAIKDNMLISIDRSIVSNDVVLKELTSSSNQSINKLGSIPTQEREFLELKRSQIVQNTLYSFLLQKREENELVLAAAIPKGEIIDLAYTSSEPVAPKKALTIIICLLAGLLSPVVILYLKDLFSNKFSSQEELERLVNAPVIGELCHNRHRGYLIVKNGKTSSIVELFRLVRNNLQFMLPGKKEKLILVSSSVSGEGKSFISTNIASSFALLDKKVLLIGLDIRSPKLSEYLGLKAAPGATNYFADETISFDSLVQHTEVNNLDVIVAGPIPPNPSELLLRDRVAELFDTAKEKYDYVIVDSAPVAMVSDTFSISRYADVVLYVTRANYTLKRHINYLNQLIDRKQLNNVAVIINDTNPKTSQGYGYGYGEQKED